MDGVTECPHCQADLIGGTIPEEQRASYGGHATFFRTIGLSVRGKGDVTLCWECPDCKGRWHRWPETSRHFAEAEPYIRGPVEGPPVRRKGEIVFGGGKKK